MTNDYHKVPISKSASRITGSKAIMNTILFQFYISAGQTARCAVGRLIISLYNRNHI